MSMNSIRRNSRRAYLVDELTAVDVVSLEHLCPELKLAPLDEVPSLLLEHRVVIGDADELLVAEALGVRDVRKVRVARLAEFTDNERLVELGDNVSIWISVLVELLTLFSLRNCSGLLLLSM